MQNQGQFVSSFRVRGNFCREKILFVQHFPGRKVGGGSSHINYSLSYFVVPHFLNIT
jgi:hypothetical protein